MTVSFPSILALRLAPFRCYFLLEGRKERRKEGRRKKRGKGGQEKGRKKGKPRASLEKWPNSMSALRDIQDDSGMDWYSGD